MSKAKPRVLVAMSGGVDSSFTAALLLEQGYEVIGATMQLWPGYLEPEEHENGCCSLVAVDDARQVATQLGIPYYVLNFQDVFEQRVISHFVSEYKKGRTPNPCVICNQVIKFEILLQKALALECQYLATGHYARLICDDKGSFNLWRSVDLKKDQSYFLYGIKKEHMPHLLFPLGDWTKEEVRKESKDFNLRVAAKADSQEICFVVDNEYRDFLRKHAPDCRRPGLIVDKTGEVLGRHEGIAFYTIGQRKGLGVQSERPLYVVDIDSKTNKVVVGGADDVFSKGLWAEEINWLAGEEQKEYRGIQVKIRSAAPPVAVDLKIEGERIKVSFSEPQRAVTPGQAVVFYDGDRVLGGGTIVQAISTE